jgi:hypothetical protein
MLRTPALPAAVAFHWESCVGGCSRLASAMFVREVVQGTSLGDAIMTKPAVAAIEKLESAISQADTSNVRDLPTSEIGAALKMVVSSPELQMAALDAQNWCTGLLRSLGDPDVASQKNAVEVARRNAGNAVQRYKLLLTEAEQRQPVDLQ